MNRLISRAFSAAASNAGKLKSQPNLSILDPGQWQVERLSSGSKLITSPASESNGPIQITASFSAGSRHEDYFLGEQGLTHLIRRSVGLSTLQEPSVNILRSLQQIGASVDCNTTREHINYTIDLGDAKYIKDATRLLSLITAKCEYFLWELVDVLGLYIKQDIHQLHNRQADILLSELFHKAAFGNQPLSHSLFAPKHVLGQLEYVDVRADKPPYVIPHEDIMLHYPEENVNRFINRCLRDPSRLTLICTGLPNENLNELRSGELFSLSGGAGEASTKEVATKFYAGDQRLHNPNFQVSLVAVGWPAPADPSKLITTNILLRALTGSNDSRISDYSGTVTQVGGILTEALQSSNVAVSGFLWNYSDVSVAGFQLAGPNNSSSEHKGQVTNALHSTVQAIKQVASRGLTDSQLARAKAVLKMDYLLKLETPLGVANQVAHEVSVAGKAASVDAVLRKIDGVTVQDVQKTAAEIFGGNSRAALSAVGDVWGIPHVQDLKA